LLVGGVSVHGPKQSFIKPLYELGSFFGNEVSKPFGFNYQPEPFNGVEIG
jgi:hypothetical protein